jgi:hypothetical protein
MDCCRYTAPFTQPHGNITVETRQAQLPTVFAYPILARNDSCFTICKLGPKTYSTLDEIVEMNDALPLVFWKEVAICTRLMKLSASISSVVWRRARAFDMYDEYTTHG